MRKSRRRALLGVECLEDRSLLSVGNLDPLFGNDGLLIANVLGDNAQANAVVVLRDNIDTTNDPILLAGHSNNDFLIARIETNDTVNSTTLDFGDVDTASSLAVSNGFAVVGGTTGPEGARDLAIARLETSSLDPDNTFSGDGLFTLDLGGDEVLTSLKVLTDGSILATGTTTAQGGQDIFVVKISATGILDVTFGVGGVAIIDLGSEADEANDLAVTSDGGVVIAGSVTLAHANGVNSDFAAIRLTAAGALVGISTLDFGTNLPATVAGTPVANPSYSDTAMSLTIILDGAVEKIVVAGSANNGRFDFFAMARFNLDGSLDTTFAQGATTFGPQGTITSAVGPSSDIIYRLSVQTNGKLVVAGQSLRDEFNLDQSNISVARYNTDGTLDLTFGEDGRLLTPIPNGSSGARAIDFGDNGTLVVAGFFTDGFDRNVAVARYQADIRPITQTNTITVPSDGFADTINIVPLDNDFDPDLGDSLRITQLRIDRDTGPDVLVATGQTVTLPEGRLTTDGTIVRFTPANGFSGAFTIFYTVSDGWLTSESRIDLNVQVTDSTRAGDRDIDFGEALNRVVARFAFHAVSDVVATRSDSGQVLVAATITNSTTGLTDFVVARFNTDGSLDTTFGTNGFTITDFGSNLNERVAAIMEQDNGSIVVVGSVNNNFAIARYTSAGILETTFSGDGLLIVDAGGADAASAVVELPSGGLVVGGVSNAPGTQDFALIRLSDTGVQDLTFGGTGVAYTNFRGTDILRGLAIQSGKIVAVGTADFQANAVVHDRDFALARYNLDGSLDTGFDGDGIRMDDFTDRDELFSAVVDASGNLYVAGFVGNGGTALDQRDIAVARYTTLGALDLTFAGGLATVDFAGLQDEARSLLLDNGSLFVGGFASIPNPNSLTPTQTANFAFVRLNTTTGAVEVKTATDFIGRNDVLTSLIAGPGNDVIAVGTAFDKSTAQGVGMVRYTDAGAIVTGFGGAIPGPGAIITAPGIDTSAAKAVGVQSDGKIIAGGLAVNANGDLDFTLIRYLENGKIDPSFNGGIVLQDLFNGSDDVVSDVIVLPDDKILVAGAVQIGANRDLVLARFNSDGTLDLTFGIQGKVRLDLFGEDDVVKSMALRQDGADTRIVLAGYTTQNGVRRPVVVQFDMAGNPVGLDGDGIVTLDSLGDAAEANAVAVQSDGKIVLAGTIGSGASSDVFLARLTGTGTLDATYNSGIVRIQFSGADGANALVLDADDKAYVAGFATTENNDTDFLILRVNAAGMLDTQFGSAGNGTVLLRDFGTGNDQAFGIALQNNRVVVVGVVSFGGRDAFGVAGLTLTGLTDTTFGSNGLVRTALTGDSRSFDVVIDDQNRIVTAGQGVVVANGPTRFAVLRYNGVTAGNFDPVTVEDRATTATNQKVKIPVLLNDQDQNGDVLTIAPNPIVRVGGTITGNATVSADLRNINYTPPPNQTGTETFRYFVTDGFSTVESFVNITVAAPPDIEAALEAPGHENLIQNIEFLNLGGANANGIYNDTVNDVDPGPNGFVHLTTGSTSVATDTTTAGVDNGNRLGDDRVGAYDATIIAITINVPNGHNYLTFDFSFLTNEYPGLIGRIGNDGFIAELDQSTWTIDPVTGKINAPDNFAFDVMDNVEFPVSVRSDFFDPDRVETLTDTLYNGGTPWLRAGTYVTSGTHTLYLSLFDVGDNLIRGQIDSAVFLSNLQTMTLPLGIAEGAIQGPIAGEDWLPLADAQAGIPIERLLQNDLVFDGDTIEFVSVTQGSAGTVSVSPGGILTYTPEFYFEGEDSFTYTIRDSRGTTSVGTIRVFDLIDLSTSRAAAPTFTTTAQNTDIVFSGTLLNGGIGSDPSVFTLADYRSNPVAVPIGATTFFDVYAPKTGASDQVVVIVNDPTGNGQLFYFNGDTWQPVRSSNGQLPERISPTQLRVVLDSFSFPRVNYLLGTVFSIPIGPAPATTSTTVSTSTASAGTTDAGSQQASITLRSDLSLTVGVTSSTFSAVRAGESSLSLNQGQGASSRQGQAASGSSKDEEADSALLLELAWMYELNPEAADSIVKEWQITGKLSVVSFMQSVPPPTSFEAFETAGPEEEEQELREEDFEISTSSPGTPQATEEVPVWAWAAMGVAPLLTTGRRVVRRSSSSRRRAGWSV